MNLPKKKRDSSILLKQWQAFTLKLEQNKPSQLSPIVLQSWQRCRDLGIDPHQPNYVFLSSAELKQKRLENASLIEAARPYMEHLSRCFADVIHVVALADAEGWILEMSEQPLGALGGASTGICVGSSWNEKHIGNNGIGTALATGKPTFVYGIEHYAMVYHSAYCVGVPIRADEQIVGCLDVSVIREEDARPQHLALVQACVVSIESTLNFWSQFRTKINVLEHFATIGSSLATTIHDLKNSLNLIHGFSQLGAKSSESQKKEQYFQKVIERSNQMNETLSNLQRLSEPPRLMLANPRLLLQETIADMVFLSTIHGIDLVVAIDECDISTLLQPDLFKRAIMNLLSNAIEAISGEGSVMLQAKIVEDAYLLITIADTGNGIPSEIQPRIFEPFISRRDNGTGLGLYMVHQTITETHQGKIWFETAPEEGTTFFIKIPLRSS